MAQVVRERGDWMQTFTGKRFYPLDPDPNDVCIEDIAHALSMICRYQGHTKRFYSVAEHCVILSRYAERAEHSPTVQYALLMHDASEAYLCDMVRPVKLMMREYHTLYSDMETAVTLAINVQLAVPMSKYLVDIVKSYDNRIVYNEAEALLSIDQPHQKWYIQEGPPLSDVSVEGWAPEVAEQEFLSEYSRIKKLLDIPGI